MNDPEPFITLLSHRDVLEPAEALQIEAELRQLRRLQDADERIWRGLLGLFAVVAITMMVRQLLPLADALLARIWP